MGAERKPTAKTDGTEPPPSTAQDSGSDRPEKSRKVRDERRTGREPGTKHTGNSRSRRSGDAQKSRDLVRSPPRVAEKTVHTVQETPNKGTDVHK